MYRVPAVGQLHLNLSKMILYKYVLLLLHALHNVSLIKLKQNLWKILLFNHVNVVNIDFKLSLLYMQQLRPILLCITCGLSSLEVGG